MIHVAFAGQNHIATLKADHFKRSQQGKLKSDVDNFIQQNML